MSNEEEEDTCMYIDESHVVAVVVNQVALFVRVPLSSTDYVYNIYVLYIYVYICIMYIYIYMYIHINLRSS
jgi:hypothetical protein